LQIKLACLFSLSTVPLSLDLPVRFLDYPETHHSR